MDRRAFVAALAGVAGCRVVERVGPEDGMPQRFTMMAGPGRDAGDFSAGLYTAHLEPNAWFATPFLGHPAGGPNALTQLVNLIPALDGTLVSRFGTQVWAEPADFPVVSVGGWGIHLRVRSAGYDRTWFFGQGGVTNYLLAPATGNPEDPDSANGFTAMAGSPLATGTPVSAVHGWDGSADAVYFGNNLAANGKYTKVVVSTAVASVITPPAVLSGITAWVAFAWHNRRLWALGLTGSGYVLAYSSLDDGDTLGDESLGGGVEPLSDLDRGLPLSLHSVGEELLLLYRNGVDVIRGWSAAEVSIATNLSAFRYRMDLYDHWATVRAGGVVYAVGRQGVFAITADGVQRVSEPLALQDFGPAASFGVVRLAWDEVNDQILIGGLYGTLGIGSLMLAFDRRTGTWGMFSFNIGSHPGARLVPFGMGNAVFLGFTESAGTLYVYRPKTELYRDNVASDGSTGSANAYQLTAARYFEPGGPNTRKALRWGYLNGTLDSAPYLQVTAPDGSTEVAAANADPTTGSFRVPLALGGREYLVSANMVVGGAETRPQRLAAFGLEGFVYPGRFA